MPKKFLAQVHPIAQISRQTLGAEGKAKEDIDGMTSLQAEKVGAVYTGTLDGADLGVLIEF